MMDDSGNIRSPFRPLQQSTHLNKNRLRDSPMDFSYDTPQRENGISPSWLDRDEDKKRSREALDGSEVFSFGSKNATAGTPGAFLFHQPLEPTVAGPDVEMSSETTPVKAATDSSRFAHEQTTDENSSRPLVSSGALTRVIRNRGASGKRGAGTSEQKKSQSTSQTKGRRKTKTKIQDGDWEDDEVEDVNESKSIWRRAGDTTNIQYVFGGGSMADSEKRRHANFSWLDPEWCLGMAQVAFNALLLFSILYVIYGVIQTLQRDVADKVREYELEFLSEIEACSHSYHLNKCGTEGAVPALASACASWQKCSAKDPAIVGRARVAAETVAEIVNGFVDVVSWKSMLFTLLSLVIIVGATNSTLSFFRLRSRKVHDTSHPMSNHHHHHPNGDPYDPRSIHPAYRNAAMYPPYPSRWHASPPPTPSTKRMCR